MARTEWFADPTVIGRIGLIRAKWYARAISSPRINRSDVRAITLGRTIHFRKMDRFDPHTARGLALLAHEAKHVEQYERQGLLKFCAKYVWAYVFNGYGESVPFEGEAYDFERKVRAHLEQEFGENPGIHFC